MSDAPRGDRWLLLRRGETLWAVPSESVRSVRRLGNGADVLLASSISLQADELLGMASSLERRSFPGCVVPGAVGTLAGLAIWQGEPVVCVDPTGPLPPVLVAPPPPEPTTTDTLARSGPEDADEP